MIIDENNFLNIPFNTNAQTPCSPIPPGPTWRGILIQAPQRVKFRRGNTVGEHGAFAGIPICGYLLLDVPPIPTSESMRLIAVDSRTGHVYSGDIVELDESPEVPPPGHPSSPEERRGLAVGGFFNPNLADYVALPMTSAVYHVHLEYREYRSNQVSIELVEI